MADQNLEEILDILACPACKAPVKLRAREILCTSKECRRAYAIDESGIPNFIIENSAVKSPEEWQAAVG